MKLAIIGSRSYPRLSLVRDYVHALPAGTVVITGGWPSRAGGYHVVEATRGVDRTAYEAAEQAGLITVLVAGSVTKHGKMAGLRRNPITIELAEAVVAFWDSESRGTASSLLLAQQLQRPARVIGPDGQEIASWAPLLARLDNPG